MSVSNYSLDEEVIKTLSESKHGEEITSEQLLEQHLRRRRRQLPEVQYVNSIDPNSTIAPNSSDEYDTISYNEPRVSPLPQPVCRFRHPETAAAMKEKATQAMFSKVCLVLTCLLL